MNIVEWLSHEKNVEAYIKWKNSPITIALLDGLKDLYAPRRVSNPKEESALQELGFVAGRHSVINSLMNLEILSSAGEDSAIDDRQKKFLQEIEGYSEEEAERIIKQIEGDNKND